MLVALEGLPGAGKTTSAELLAERLGIDLVCETTADHPFIDTVYDDASRHDLQVELAFLLLHQAAYRGISPGASAVTDYSPAKDLLFADAMLSGSDLALFQTVYTRLYDGLSVPDVVVYLDAPPSVCIERVRRRLEQDADRHFEALMTVDRLRRMASLYEERLADLGKVVLRHPVTREQSKRDVLDSLVELLSDRLPFLRSP